MKDDTMIAVTYPHLTVDPSGVATITGTTTKVVEIARDRIADHWDADEIQILSSDEMRNQVIHLPL